MAKAVAGEARIQANRNKRNNNNVVKNNITSYTSSANYFGGRHSIAEVDKTTRITVNRPKTNNTNTYNDVISYVSKVNTFRCIETK